MYFGTDPDGFYTAAGLGHCARSDFSLLNMDLRDQYFSVEDESRREVFMATPNYYEIRIEGSLSDRWSDWFAGLTITYDLNNETILSGELVDQASLHGVLMKIRDLHLVLISINRIQQPPRGIWTFDNKK